MNTTKDQIRNVLLEFIPVLDAWKDTETGSMLDPFETDYSENYAPANAAFIYAGTYRFSHNKEHLEGCLSMVRRSVELMKERSQVNPFCRVFLNHYSLASLLLLPDHVRKEIKSEFADFYAEYQDDCGQINTNCAALHWGMELFLEAAGFRMADLDYTEHLVDYIEKAQLTSGFINDSVEKGVVQDGMPIAYHLFIMFILLTVHQVADVQNPKLEQQLDRTSRVLSKGMDWLIHAIAEDGTLAMAERSRYQMFTWGALTALMSATSLKKDEIFHKTFNSWLQFKQEDGTYSCVPNHWPHAARCGFERYTRINMYNNLGMTGIVLADRLLSDDHGPLPTQNNSLTSSENVNFSDPDSGYAFYRKDGAFFGCVLRTHRRGYVHAMQGFHYRLRDLPLPLPDPMMRDVNANRDLGPLNGLWEGFLLYDKEQQPIYANTDDQVDSSFVRDGIQLRMDTPKYFCEKRIQMRENRIIWQYRLDIKENIQKSIHVIPILLHDGQEHTKVKLLSDQMIRIVYAGRVYHLECKAAASMNLQLNRSMVSVSGLASNIHITLETPLNEGFDFNWETSLTYIGDADNL